MAVENWYFDSDEEFEPDPDASIKTMTEDEAVKKILQEIDDNSVNDGGFYTAIQKLEGVEAAGQEVHQLNTSCDWTILRKSPKECLQLQA